MLAWNILLYLLIAVCEIGYVHKRLPELLSQDPKLTALMRDFTERKKHFLLWLAIVVIIALWPWWVWGTFSGEER